MNTHAFKVLFAFMDRNTGFIEIKRLDLPKDAPRNALLHCLFLQEAAVQRLTFVSMEREPREHRTFLEGELWFDQTRAQLTVGDQTFELQTVPSAQLPVATLRQVQAYLDGVDATGTAAKSVTS